MSCQKNKSLLHNGYTVAPSWLFDPTTEPLCLYLLYRHSLSQFLFYWCLLPTHKTLQAQRRWQQVLVHLQHPPYPRSPHQQPQINRPCLARFGKLTTRIQWEYSASNILGRECSGEDLMASPEQSRQAERLSKIFHSTWPLIQTQYQAQIKIWMATYGAQIFLV